MSRATRPRRRVRGASPALAKALGDACEALVLRALGHCRRPWWIRSVRRARAIEDRHGVDIVVHTEDLGRLFLQVKRSTHHLAAWYRKWGNDPRPIGVVIAGEWEAVEVVYGRALGALILLRERVEGLVAASGRSTGRDPRR